MGRKNRNTRQKEVISETLANIESFFNAEDLYALAKKKDSSLGISTIYRYLNEAKQKGELFTYICDRKTVYSKGKKSHCHYECEKTGKVFHFEIDNIDFLKDKIPGTITSFQLEVRGVCNKCDSD